MKSRKIIFTTVLSALVCFGLCQQVQSATDTPDPGAKPLSNTADGAGALLSNTTGGSNTAVGAFALFSNVDGGGHTAVGIGALEHNNASGFLASNTAVGVSALVTSTSGGANVDVGEGALLSSDTGS